MDTQTLSELSKAVNVELKTRDNKKLIEETFEHLKEKLDRIECSARKRTKGVTTEKTLTPEKQREKMGKLD
jgi:hypothetical protein